MGRGAAIAFSFFALLATGALAGCDASSRSPSPRPRPSVGLFESDDPGLPGDLASRDCTESFEDRPGNFEGAEVVQIDNDRLYALSGKGGLSVIDIGARDALTLLGRFRAHATPVGLHLRGDLVLATWAQYGTSVFDEAAQIRKWVRTSRVVALDTSDPARIRELGHFEVPGVVYASHLRGDIVYLVSFRDGSCWDCGTEPKVVITSVDVSNPAALLEADELEVAPARYQTGAGKRPATITPKRIYITGPEGDGSSTLQLVDIQDPKGALVVGKRLETPGAIWSVDEHEGILRMVSQPDAAKGIQPRIQTLDADGELRPLGSLGLTLMDPDRLRGVHFDGVRAFAYVFDRPGEIVTIDLEDPARPSQRGAVKTPGWVETLESRGDRLYAFGYDHRYNHFFDASLYDTSVPSNPTMLDSIGFGHNVVFGLSQKNRIQRGLQVLPEAGLALIPYTGHQEGELPGQDRTWSSVQIVDLSGDRLTKRGEVSSRGEIRRAYWQGGRLLTVSDWQVQSVDIERRDVPTPLASTRIAQRVDRLLVADDYLVRFALDWRPREASLEVVRKTEAEEHEALGGRDLASTFVDSPLAYCEAKGARHSYVKMLANEHYVYLLRSPVGRGPGEEETTALVIDVSNPEAPRRIRQKHFPFAFAADDATGQVNGNAIIEAGEDIVRLGSTVALLNRQRSDDEGLGVVHILDFGNPKEPYHSAIDLPKATWRSALQGYGTTVMVGRYSRSSETASKVHFYVDRIDVSDPRNPRVLPSINLPGSLLSYEPSSDRFITVDYKVDSFAAESVSACTNEGRDKASFDAKTGTCTKIRRSLELLQIRGANAERLESLPLPDDLWVAQAARGDDRVYLLRGSPPGDQDDDCGYGCEDGLRLDVIGGARAGKLQIERHEMDGVRGALRMLPFGQRLIVSGSESRNAVLVDSRTPGSLTTTILGDLRGHLHDMVADDDRAYFALGGDGVQAFELAR